MRRLVIPAISIGVTLLLMGSASGATRLHSKIAPFCHLPARARQRLADEYIQVYESGEGITEVFACAYGHRHTYLLNTPRPCPSSYCEIPLRHLVIAGPYVAYEPEQRNTSNIIVRNIATGRVIHKTSTATPANPDFSAEQIVLKADGSVAWIATRDIGKASQQVHAFDRSGNRLLAYVNENEDGFLALVNEPGPFVTPSALYWTQEGKPMSATLD
jgi:hypothetical protein